MATYYVRKRDDPTLAPPNTSGLFYFFDGSDAAAVGSSWTDVTNGDDMNIATSTYTTTANNGLYIEGTNAPSSGDSIASVALWVYLGSGNLSTACLAEVFEDGGVLLEGSFAITVEVAGAWNTFNFQPITEPAGGWTWAKVQSLEARIYTNQTSRLEVAAVGVLVETTVPGTTTADPFRTINEAANAVAAGDTVYVGAGTYRESVTMDTSGTSGNQISYIADVDGSQTGDPGLVVISAYTNSNTVNRSLCWDPDGRTFITVRGFVMQGGQSGVVYDANTTNSNYEGVIFEDCVFVAGPDGADFGMYVDANAGTSPASQGLTVRRCLFQGSGITYRWDGNVVADQDLKVLIESNLFLAATPSALSGGAALHWQIVTGSTFASGGVTFRHNTVLGMGYGCYVNNGASVAYPVAATDNLFMTGAQCLIKQSTNDGALTSNRNTLHAQSPFSNVTAGTGDREETSTWLLGGIADMPLYRFLGWSPYKPFEPMRANDDTDWSSLIGDATTGPAFDLYNNPRPMAQAGYTRSVYYFDASDSGPTDPDGVWTNDANAFNGNTVNTATTTTNGTEVTNELRAEGTNAPATGGAIVGVEFRIYTGTVGGQNFRIYADGGTESLYNNATSVDNTWTAWLPLTTPSGGWTWPKVQALEVVLWAVTQPGEVGAVEVRVSHASLGGSDRGAVEGRARPERETTTIDTGSTAVRFEGAGYHDMMFPVAATGITVSVRARKDANYTGTAPQLVVLNIPGVADQTDTHAVAADTWETLSVTFTPTAAGVARIRFLSNDTSATGCSFFDTLTVS